MRPKFLRGSHRFPTEQPIFARRAAAILIASCIASILPSDTLLAQNISYPSQRVSVAGGSQPPGSPNSGSPISGSQAREAVGNTRPLTNAWTANAGPTGTPNSPGQSSSSVSNFAVQPASYQGNAQNPAEIDRQVNPQAAPSAYPSKEAATPLQPPSSKTGEASSKPSGSGTFETLLSIGSSLLIVIGLFLGVAWCYRKTLSTSMGSMPKQVVQVLGRTPIANRQQLVLIRFGSKLVLVSLVQGEARTISEITDPLEVDQIAGICESSSPDSISSSFRSVLAQGGA